MKTKDYRPVGGLNRDDKYWSLHKEIYFDELDSLDDEIKNIIINKPHGSTAKRFNRSIESLIAQRLKESNNQSE